MGKSSLRYSEVQLGQVQATKDRGSGKLESRSFFFWHSAKEVNVENLLTPADAALVMIKKGHDTTPASVRSYADKGQLPVIRTAGGRRLFNRQDVEKFAAMRKARKA